MESEAIAALARFGPEWILGGLVLLCAFVLGRQFLEEYKEQNQRKSSLEEKQAKWQAELEVKREERKRDELQEQARKNREDSEWKGQIATQMARSNTLIEGVKTLMESVLVSNDALHADFMTSRERSQGMADDVTHIRDRVDLLYDKESSGKKE